MCLVRARGKWNILGLVRKQSRGILSVSSATRNSAKVLSFYLDYDSRESLGEPPDLSLLISMREDATRPARGWGDVAAVPVFS